MFKCAIVMVKKLPTFLFVPLCFILLAIFALLPQSCSPLHTACVSLMIVASQQKYLNNLKQIVRSYFFIITFLKIICIVYDS